MIKKHTGILVVILMVLAILPFVNVQALESATVYNEETLKAAIQNADIDTIVLSEDIETHEKINITRDLTLDGANHTIKYAGTFKGGSDNTVWDSIYVLQVYKADVTIKNIKLTNGNAGLLVNGGRVKLEGKIDLSGNGFGGMELGKGVGVTQTPYLELDKDTDLVNTTESYERPTVWVPDDTEKARVVVDGKDVTFKAGDELSISEFEEIMEMNNPETGDTILLFGVLGLVGLISLGFGLRELVINNKSYKKEL